MNLAGKRKFESEDDVEDAMAAAEAASVAGVDAPNQSVSKQIFEASNAVIARRDTFALYACSEAEVVRVASTLMPLLHTVCDSRHLIEADFNAVNGGQGRGRVTLLYDLTTADESMRRPKGRGTKPLVRASWEQMRVQMEREPHVALIVASFNPDHSIVVVMQRIVAPWIIGGLASHFVRGPLKMPETFAPLYMLAYISRRSHLEEIEIYRRERAPAAFWHANFDVGLLQRFGATRWLFFNRLAAAHLLEGLDEIEFNKDEVRRVALETALVVSDTLGTHAPAGRENEAVPSRSVPDEFDLLCSPDDDLKKAAMLTPEGRWRAGERHELWDRLVAPGANERLRTAWADIYALAFELFARVGNFNQDSVHFQAWLHIGHQLLRAEIDYSRDLVSVARRVWSTTRGTYAPQIKPCWRRHAALVDAAEELVANVPALIFAGVECAAQKLADSVYLAVYGQTYMHQRVREVFKTFDVGSVLAVEQQVAQDYLVRQHSAVPVVAIALASSPEVDEWFQSYLRQTGQVFAANRIAQLRQADDAASAEPLGVSILQLPLNCHRNTVGVQAKRLEPLTQWRRDRELRERCHRHASNALTPQAVQASILSLMPWARDGIDFFICYSPLSAMPANACDTRGSTAVVEYMTVQCREFADKGSTALLAARAGKSAGRPKKWRAGTAATEPGPDATPMLMEPSLFVWMRDGSRMQRVLAQAVATAVLWRRVTGDEGRAAHVPLVAPAVVRVLSESTEPAPLCQSLNAISGMFGLSTTEWDPQTFRGRTVAEQAARLVAPVLDLYARAASGTDFYSDGGVEFMWTSTFQSWLSAREFRKAVPRAAIAGQLPQQELAGSCVGAPLSVLLNAAVLPVTCSARTYRWLRETVFVDNQRVSEHFSRVEHLHECRLRDNDWGQVSPACARSAAGRRYSRRHALPVDTVVHPDEVRRRALLRFNADDPDLQRAGATLDDADFDRNKTRVCRCGAATLMQCDRMARAAADQEYIDWMCCICAGGGASEKDPDTMRADDPHGFRFMYHHCKHCRTRVSWYSHGADQMLLPDNVQIYEPPLPVRQDNSVDAVSDYQTLMARGAGGITPYTIIEGVLDFVRARNYDADDVAAAVEFFDSLRFRIYKYCTAAPLPLHRHNDAMSGDGRFSELATSYVAAAMETRERLRVTSRRLSRSEREVVETDYKARSGKGARAPTAALVSLSHSLPHPHRAPAQAPGTPLPTDAAVLWLTTMELTQLLSVEHAANLCDRVRRSAHSGVSWLAATAHLDAWRFFLAPFSTSRAAAQFYEHQLLTLIANGKDYFPLCSAALAESSALGAAGANGVMSDDRVDPAHRIGQLLYTGHGGMPRPLATALPLLAELSLLNYYDE